MPLRTAIIEERKTHRAPPVLPSDERMATQVRAVTASAAAGFELEVRRAPLNRRCAPGKGH